jgi:hypothetical protein
MIRWTNSSASVRLGALAWAPLLAAPRRPRVFLLTAQSYGAPAGIFSARG